ncbi:MAG: NBR1-Ig-like domain-containing protein [Anaerolineales bacterium]
MTKTRLISILLLAVALLISACGPRPTPTPEPLPTTDFTALRQTQEVQATPELVLILPENTPLPTPEPLVLPAVTPLPSPTPIPCNKATFVADVTIPDGTAVRPGEPMRKTWRLRNDGTCVWSGYTLIFSEGTNMGASAVDINATVYPGETVDVSIDLTAPNRVGSHTGYYKLRDSGGNIFGITSRNGKEIAFWVRIRVELTQVTYDLAADALNARWDDGVGQLPFNSYGGAPERGGVYDVTSPKMEDKTYDNARAIQVAPNYTKNGYLQGTFPFYIVQAGDHFVAGVGCHADAKKCFMTFQLSYREEGGAPVVLRTWTEKNEGLINNVIFDLSSLAGKRVSFILTVNAGDDPSDDLGFWLQPRIMR